MDFCKAFGLWKKSVAFYKTFAGFSIKAYPLKDKQYDNKFKNFIQFFYLKNIWKYVVLTKIKVNYFCSNV